MTPTQPTIANHYRANAEHFNLNLLLWRGKHRPLTLTHHNVALYITYIPKSRLLKTSAVTHAALISSDCLCVQLHSWRVD